MSEQRFEPMRVVDNVAMIYDSLTDDVLKINDIANKLNEQQSTINKLQDLCGESDYENAKLRIENKELQRKIDMLCEVFNYGSDESIRKVKEWQKTRKDADWKGKIVD